MNYRMLFPSIFALALMCSCGKTAGGQHAILAMRDGTTINGTVLSSSPTEIQLSGDDKVTHRIPMTQVRSIEYEDTPADLGKAPIEASSTSPQTGNAAPPRGRFHGDHYHPVESAITTTTSEVPAGTEISVRNEETIDSGKAAEGQTFPAEVTKDVLDAAGNVVIPRGSNAQITIRSASRGGRVRGASDLVMYLVSVSVDGRQYQISTADLAERGRSGIGANRRTAEFTGGGAAIGAIIGAIAGGGKGAAIGAGSGAGAGALTQVLTRGTIKVPAESILTFKLDKPLRVRAAR
jgi:hypothetical protein